MCGQQGLQLPVHFVQPGQLVAEGADLVPVHLLEHPDHEEHRLLEHLLLHLTELTEEPVQKLGRHELPRHELPRHELSRQGAGGNTGCC